MSDAVPKKIGSGFSTASLVLGIVGLVLAGGLLVIPGILGLVFGIMGMESEKKRTAVAGVVLNSIQVFLSAVSIIVLITNPNIRNMLNFN